MSLRVRDLMRTNLITCPPTTTLSAAVALLVRHNVHAIVVADPSGMQQGLVTDAVLLAGEEASLADRTAEQVMTTPVPTIDADTPARDAAARMLAEGLPRLVVTEHDRGIGVLAVSDLVRVLVPALPPRQTVGQVMARGLVVCRADTPIAAAARAMTERRSRSLVVVDAHGRPLGVVTGHDLLPLIAAGTTAASVAELMHPPVTIGPEATLREAAARLLEHGLQRLVVIDPAQPDAMPLGVISTSDLLQELAAPSTPKGPP